MKVVLRPATSFTFPRRSPQLSGSEGQAHHLRCREVSCTLVRASVASCALAEHGPSCSTVRHPLMPLGFDALCPASRLRRFAGKGSREEGTYSGV
jgi:hypothetical protein